MCHATPQLKRKYERELRDAKHGAEAKMDDVSTNLRKQVCVYVSVWVCMSV